MNYNAKLIPVDMNYVPSDEAIAEVEEYIENEEIDGYMIKDHVDYIEVWKSSKLRYLDEGDSFMPTICCPNCHSDISDEDYEEWRANFREELMDISDADEGDLSAYRVSTPCCNSDVIVTSFDFKGYAGFARFGISIEGDDLSEKNDGLFIKEVEKILGCEMKRISLVST